MRSLAADKAHRSRWRDETGNVDVVAWFFLHHNPFDVVDDLCARGAVAHHVAQRVLDGGKETGANLPVGRQSNARTGAAEWFGHRRDDSDLAGRAVGKAIT